MESSVSSSRVLCRCGKRIFNAVIRSGLERNREVPICSDTQDTKVRIKRRLPSSLSSQDRSPQVQALKKSLNFSESTPSNATNKENMPFDVNQETITPRVSRFTAELNVKILCGKQTTQLEELIVNPNDRIDSYCRLFYILRALTIPAATQVFISPRGFATKCLTTHAARLDYQPLFGK